MNNLIQNQDDLISYIKNVIIKYCPYIENRFKILGNLNAPQLDIEIYVCNNDSQIMFMFGNYGSKSSISERATTSYVISFNEICDIINFILNDHEIIKDINFNNSKIDLTFAINWTDKSINGINCSDIGLNLYFEDIELKNQYLYLLFQKYYIQLEQVTSFKNMKNEYITNIKNSYFENLNKEQLLGVLNEMSEKDLKELLNNMDNDIFIKYANNDKDKSNVKVLSLEENI